MTLNPMYMVQSIALSELPSCYPYIDRMIYKVARKQTKNYTKIIYAKRYIISLNGKILS